MFKDLNLPMHESKELVTGVAPHGTVTQGISNTENNHPVCTRTFDVQDAQRQPTLQKAFSKDIERRTECMKLQFRHFFIDSDQKGRRDDFLPSMPAESISLSKCPVFPTNALFINFFMWSKVMSASFLKTATRALARVRKRREQSPRTLLLRNAGKTNGERDPLKTNIIAVRTRCGSSTLKLGPHHPQPLQKRSSTLKLGLHRPRPLQRRVQEFQWWRMHQLLSDPSLHITIN